MPMRSAVFSIAVLAGVGVSPFASFGKRMEIGNEISKKIRDAIKSKLQELGSYVDDELPDYIMVMLANKRNENQMTEDLMLFLGENTAKFTDWLYKLLEKLQQVTTLQDNEVPTQTEARPIETTEPQPATVTSNTPPQSRKERSPSPTKARKKSPLREPTQENKSTARNMGRRHSSDKQERSRITSTVEKSSSSSRSSSRRRRTDSDNEDASKRPSSLSSIVKVKEKRRSLSPSKQATSRLFKKAIAEAHMSVNQLANSSSYDPTLPPQPMKTNSYAEKQHQKELLLQQHRELVRQQQGMQEEQKGEKEEPVEHDAAQKTEDEAAKEAETTSTTTAGVEEPVIELRVSEAEALEYSIEDKGDTRVVAFADSQGGAEESEEEKRRRRRKRRAVKSKERSSSPRFIVTLDGVGSDLEDRFDITEKEERHKKLKKEVDDFQEVDTATANTAPHKLPIPAPVVEPVQLRLGAATQPVHVTAEVDSIGPQAPAQPQDRCRFWPDCKNGDSCPYYHPTVPCRSFPNCRFGDKCLFIHPACKFDAGCTNPLCGFMHPSKTKSPAIPVAPPFSGPPRPFAAPVNSPAPVPCRFYPNCTKPNCQFFHPPKKACRFGAGCTREGCVFGHPPKPSDLKWVKPAAHISERGFAVTLESVTPMPVK